MSDWDPSAAGRETGKQSPFLGAIDRLVQSGDMPADVGIAVLGGMIEGMLRDVFVPLSKALDYEVVEKKKGSAVMVVNLRNGDQIRLELSK